MWSAFFVFSQLPEIREYVWFSSDEMYGLVQMKYVWFSSDEICMV